ncbi:MAG: polyprenyl synthetase family protein [Planctomycetes bacterium]|nr:polyprenyl synthetase family protein [Planctomycetota bacterium]
MGSAGEVSAAEILAPVRAEMEAVERRLRAEVEQADPRLAPLLADASLLRGKGLRPGLVFLVARATGALRPDHITLASALEMIHNATLIHDDILDDATARRNQMTLNLKYNNEMAVLIGDYIFARAFVLAHSMDSADAVAQIGRMATAICRGEIKQVLRRFDADLDEAAYFELIAEKTGSLYEAAGELGARLAGAAADTIRTCAEYGAAIGVAFQIVDDCLDLVGQEAVMGKTLATDLDKGKLTLPVIRYLGAASPEVRRELMELIGSAAVSRGDKRARFVGRLRDSGAIDYAYARAVQETERAKGLLAALAPSPARTSLEQLADFVVRRQC